MRAKQAKKKNVSWTEKVWEWWNREVLLLCLCQSSAGTYKGEAKGGMDSPRTFSPSLPSFLQHWQLSWFFSASSSALWPHPASAFPMLPGQQLGMGICLPSAGCETQITLICWGALNQAGGGFKINTALVAAGHKSKSLVSMNHISKDANEGHKAEYGKGTSWMEFLLQLWMLI